MKTCPKMQKVIEALAEKHNVDLRKSGAYLKLTMDCYMPLVIENTGGCVSVAHYYEQNGDLCCDPDVVFFIGYDKWVPVEIQYPLMYQRVADITYKNGKWEIFQFKSKSMNKIGDFAEQWAQNIHDQGWLAEGASDDDDSRI